ncbi:MAG TPA: sugar isomerase domain-containing protein [Symbiobacteriaceae bacterium]|nr:sugar isomerase domain-containing protein [Symbiobacteriaceae bacterium]
MLAAASRGVVVSFPVPGSAFDTEPCLRAVAEGAGKAGAAAVRTYTPQQTAVAHKHAGLPVFGSWMQPDRRGLQVLTPDVASARVLAGAGTDVVVLDGSAAAHPVPGLLAELIAYIRHDLERQALAVVQSPEEAERAAAYGAAFVATRSCGQIPAITRAVPVPVMLDAGCETPEQVRNAIQAGAAMVGTGQSFLPTGELIRRLAAAAEPAFSPLSAERYWVEAAAVIARMQATPGPAIREAAAMCASAILAGGVVQVFGAGHSRAFGMEMSGRAGGLVPMHVFGLEEVAPPGRRGLALLDLERSPETAHALLGVFPILPADVFIIASNSGRNGCPVELALELKRRGHKVIAVTSLDHSSNVTSRHPSGLRLFELADVLIDNGAPFGDALLSAPGLRESVCAVSSVTGALIAQALTAEIIRLIGEAGAEPPVYISANVDGSDLHNAMLEERYRGRI